LLAIGCLEGPVQGEQDSLLSETAVGTEATFEQTQVVFFRRLPESCATVTNHDDITDTIRGEFEEATGLVTCADVLDPCHSLELPHNLLGATVSSR
jgi:hypothetical protein